MMAASFIRVRMALVIAANAKKCCQTAALYFLTLCFVNTACHVCNQHGLRIGKLGIATLDFGKFHRRYAQMSGHVYQAKFAVLAQCADEYACWCYVCHLPCSLIYFRNLLDALAYPTHHRYSHAVADGFVARISPLKIRASSFVMSPWLGTCGQWWFKTAHGKGSISEKNCAWKPKGSHATLAASMPLHTLP